MKNTKKILSILLIFALVFSSAFTTSAVRLCLNGHIVYEEVIPLLVLNEDIQ